MAELKNKNRFLIILLAFITGGAVPIQLVTFSFGFAQYVKGAIKGPPLIMTANQFANIYIPFIYLPAIVVLVGLTLYARKKYPDVYRRIVIGLGVGALSTVALDFFRQMGVIHHWLPGDTPVMFGKMATASNELAVFYPIGFIIHFLNGADFGLFYTFVWGKRKNYQSAIGWAVFWLLIVELGMMTLSPMAPMVGAFGINFAWPQLFLITLAAHVSFGVCLGILAQYFLKEQDKGGLISFIKGRYASNTSGIKNI